MSKAAKQTIIIMIVIVGVSLATAGWFCFQTQTLKKEKAGVEANLAKTQNVSKKQASEISGLKTQVQKVNSEKANVQRQLDQANKKVDGLMSDIQAVESERDKWQSRVDSVRNERDELVGQVQILERKVSGFDGQMRSLQEANDQLLVEASNVAKKQIQTVPQIMEPKMEVFQTDYTQMTQSKKSQDSNEDYWASLLRDKASLEVEVDSLKDDLSYSSIELLEIKQKYESMVAEVESLKREKENITEEIVYKDEMIDNLSLELARTKNDKKFSSNRINKLNTDNQNLRSEIKTLVFSKSALEKSIVKLTQDKNKMAKEIGKTESLIQSKIDEIWEIKDSLDRTFKSTRRSTPSSDIELPPIFVNSKGASAVPFDDGSTQPGLNGRVVSVNNDNNFVIVDLGENKGIRLGNTLSVYRDAKYIARLEVIQVRKDISAADIKDQWSKLQVGDVVQ